MPRGADRAADVLQPRKNGKREWKEWMMGGVVRRRGDACVYFLIAARWPCWTGAAAAGPCQGRATKEMKVAADANTRPPHPHGVMNSVRAIQQLNKRELEAGITPDGSWHSDYRDTAFIYIGGLPFELSEGDVITIFSQYGEPVWIKLARDKETGKSRGFAWIKYEDQRSCDLAVDNLGGANIMDRVLRVDHARYKPRDDEDMKDNTMGELSLDPGHESDGARRKRGKTESESDDDYRPMLPEEIELERLLARLDEEDPMRASLVKRQQDKVDEALRKLKKQQRKEKERARRKDTHRHRDGSRDRERRKIRDAGEARSSRHSRRRDDRSRSRDKHSSDKQRRRASRSRDGSDEDRRRKRARSRERREDSRSRLYRSRSAASPLPYRARSPR